MTGSNGKHQKSIEIQINQEKNRPDYDEAYLRTQESFISISNFTKDQNKEQAQMQAGLQEKQWADINDGAQAAQSPDRQLMKTNTNFNLLK